MVLVVPHHCHEDPSCGLTYFEAASKGKKACEGDWRGEGLEICVMRFPPDLHCTL